MASDDAVLRSQKASALAAVADLALAAPDQWQRLSGGLINFVWRAGRTALNGAHDRASSVIVKHSAPFLACDASIPLSPERLGFEARCLTALQDPHLLRSVVEDGHDAVHVAVPQLLAYLQHGAVGVLSDCGPHTALDAWVAEQAKQERRSEAERAVQAAGRALGRFIARLHTTSYLRRTNTDAWRRLAPLGNQDQPSGPAVPQRDDGSMAGEGEQVAQDAQCSSNIASSGSCSSELSLEAQHATGCETPSLVTSAREAHATAAVTHHATTMVAGSTTAQGGDPSIIMNNTEVQASRLRVQYSAVGGVLRDALLPPPCGHSSDGANSAASTAAPGASGLSSSATDLGNDLNARLAAANELCIAVGRQLAGMTLPTGTGTTVPTAGAATGQAASAVSSAAKGSMREHTGSSSGGLCLTMGDLWPRSVLVLQQPEATAAARVPNAATAAPSVLSAAALRNDTTVPTTDAAAAHVREADFSHLAAAAHSSASAPLHLAVIDWEFGHWGDPAQDIAHFAAHCGMLGDNEVRRQGGRRAGAGGNAASANLADATTHAVPHEDKGAVSSLWALLWRAFADGYVSAVVDAAAATGCTRCVSLTQTPRATASSPETAKEHSSATRCLCGWLAAWSRSESPGSGADDPIASATAPAHPACRLPVSATAAAHFGSEVAARLGTFRAGYVYDDAAVVAAAAEAAAACPADTVASPMPSSGTCGGHNAEAATGATDSATATTTSHSTGDPAAVRRRAAGIALEAIATAAQPAATGATETATTPPQHHDSGGPVAATLAHLTSFVERLALSAE